MEKATRVLTDEDKEMMDKAIEGKNGELRKIEFILGRQKLKKSFQYEVKFKGMDHRVSQQSMGVWASTDDCNSSTPGFPEMCSSRKGSRNSSVSSMTWSRRERVPVCETQRPLRFERSSRLLVWTVISPSTTR